ncbi:cadmium resistance transporter [Actinokineospora diospyrosa]
MGVVGQALVMFAVTNVDDIVLLALFFGQAKGRPLGVVVGQYLGFAGILVASVVAALGAGLLPDGAIPLLGLVPLTLGLKAAWQLRKGQDEPSVHTGPGVLAVAGVTLANGGDNIGVYAPVFAAGGGGDMVVYSVVFLALVGVWCLLGWFAATRPGISGALSRWGHVVLPVVLIGIGVLILTSAL